MARGPTGSFRTTTTLGHEPVKAFVPEPLPPALPLEINSALRDELDSAHLALGRLDALSTLLPSPAMFLYPFIRKEAVLSSQIEGTQSSLSDLLLFELDEAPGAPLDDVREISNYVRALEHGVSLVRGGLPICIRLFREVHSKLLERGRGSRSSPGEFRRSQNWIGGTRPGNAHFVPPPPDALLDCLSELERFLNNVPERTPTLLKAALAHVQFETIHPFLDGNGRVGRLLIALLFVTEGVLREPMLYLSLYLKANRTTYYDLMQRVRTEGAWEEWAYFFVCGVRETAEGAVTTARRLAARFEDDRQQVEGLGRIAGSALRVHFALQQHPIQTIPSLTKRTGLTAPTVTAALKELVRLGVAQELTGKQRGRVFGYGSYLSILNEETLDVGLTS